MPEVAKFTPYQKFVVAVLAFIQFTVVLDFMIISPLGAILMPALQILPSQFGAVVAAYAFSASISGLLAAGFADRFDRKKMLLFFYSGFILGTLFCGLAHKYEILLVARMITGVFGGVLSSIVLAITADLFPFEMRGRVIGFVQTAFAASQVLGIPAGLFLANHWGWQSAFFMIVAVGAIVGLVIWNRLQPIDAHLAVKQDLNAFRHLRTTILNPKFTLAFLVTALLSTGGFMLMPFGSAFTVNNLGIPMDHLPMIYLITGIATMFIGPLIGRACDSFGEFPVFVFGASLSILMVLIYTHLGITPLPLVILVNVVLFVSIFSRIIPTQALTSAIPNQKNRGAFMSVNSSLQQMAGGLASVISGLIVTAEPSGKLRHFDTVGYIIIASVLATMVMMYFISQAVTASRVKATATLH